MINNILGTIVVAGLVATFVLAPSPKPLSVASRTTPSNVAAASTADSWNAARATIEAGGYVSVTALGKGADGTWRAKAYRGKTEVQLTVDGMGRISTE